MNDSVKNVWKPLCIVFAALLALSWVFFGFLYSKGGVDFSTLENPKQVQTDRTRTVKNYRAMKRYPCRVRWRFRVRRR